MLTGPFFWLPTWNARTGSSTVVCRPRRLRQPLQVAATLRADNEAPRAGGPPLPRDADHQLPGTRFSSLRDQQLLRDRAKEGRTA